MLNRRSLRSKAMQSLYAFLQCKKSDYHVAMDTIDRRLTPGFEVVELPSASEIDQNKRDATLYFQNNYLKPVTSLQAEERSEATNAANEAIVFYNNQVKKDFDYFSRGLITSLEKVEGIYILLLQLILEFSLRAQRDDLNQEQKHIKTGAPLLGQRLSQNKIIANLVANLALPKEAEIKRINWSNNSEKINDWFLNIIKKDEAILSYAVLKEPTLDDDKKIVNHLIKNIIFKNEIFENHFEESGIRWAEDKEILKGMLSKTLKGLSEDNNNDYKLELFTNDEDWEEEREFFINLFNNTVAKDEELEEIISIKTKNWDIERIAIIDKIIIKMALTEMIICPGIPVKVTINEYLEIAKRYSTPKSQQFINGLLDNISNELLAKGTIKKSGKGLIDNK